MLFSLILLSVELGFSTGLPEIIKIGGLFDVTDQQNENGKQETAFRYAVERINHAKDILPNSRLSAQIEKIAPRDSFHASKRVCHLLKSGVAGLFGPESGTTSSHVQSICDALEIPHIETRWDYMLKRNGYSINLYPSPQQISKAYLSAIQAFGWKSFTILYEDSAGLMRLQELLKSPTDTDIKIVVRQLNFVDGNKEILREVKQTGEVHIVLDCSHLRIATLLKEAQAVGMMTAYHNYLITNLDLHLVDLEDFKYGGTNITAFRLVDPDNEDVKKVVSTWMLGEKRFPGRNFPENMLINTETALMYDAVFLFAKALDELDKSQVITTKPLSCNGMETWQHGNSLVNYMKLVEMDGLTGRIKFDSRGLRTDFQLEIVELKKSGLQKVGIWHDQYGIQFQRNFTETLHEIVESLQNKTLVVTTIRSPPYSMYKESPQRLVGNDAFEGYAIDLIAEISQILKFNYTFKWVDDGAYGYKNKETGEWNGLMGELLSQPSVADLAIADLTITSQRNDDIDFTMPFMKLGISLLYQIPRKMPPKLFSFLDPFSTTVWANVGGAFVLVSLLLFLMSRFTPMEWVLLDPCDQAMEPDEVEQELYLNHCLWWAWAAIMWMGCEVAPKAMSTRMVAGSWYLFTLVMVSSYTANLAASLTAENMISPFNSAKDLVLQTEIKYGCMKGGSTCGYFQNSEDPTYSQMWNYMETNQEVFSKNNHAGIQRVAAGGYAFFMESSSIEYVIERNCQLAKVGGELDEKSYGIGLRKNSPYTQELNRAILTLQETGVFHKLKVRWWKEKGAKNCEAARNAPSPPKPLTIANVSGAFVALIAGLFLSTTAAFIEFLWSARGIFNQQNTDKFTHLKNEILCNFGRRGVKQNMEMIEPIETPRNSPSAVSRTTRNSYRVVESETSSSSSSGSSPPPLGRRLPTPPVQPPFPRKPTLKRGSLFGQDSVKGSPATTRRVIMQAD